MADSGSWLATHSTTAKIYINCYHANSVRTVAILATSKQHTLLVKTCPANTGHENDVNLSIHRARMFCFRLTFKHELESISVPKHTLGMLTLVLLFQSLMTSLYSKLLQTLRLASEFALRINRWLLCLQGDRVCALHLR